jgi:hypothetical protein
MTNETNEVIRREEFGDVAVLHIMTNSVDAVSASAIEAVATATAMRPDHGARFCKCGIYQLGRHLGAAQVCRVGKEIGLYPVRHECDPAPSEGLQDGRDVALYAPHRGA